LASIRERNGKWYAEIRKRGYTPIRKTFLTKTAAKAWSLQTEAAMDNGSWVDIREQRSTLIGPLIERYIKEVHPVRPFGKSKMATVKLTARAFADTTVKDLTPALIMAYGQTRREQVSRSTLQQELTYLAQVIDRAKTFWGVKIDDNPVRLTMREMSKLGLLGGSRKRDRRLVEGELEKLLEGAGSHWIASMIRLAVSSGMRQSEIWALEWADIDFDGGTILIRDRKHPTEKEGNDQRIPLFEGAREALLRERNGTEQDGRVFHVQRSASISDRFALLCKQQGIENLTFHDLRHEAISRMFEAGLSIPQVALVSGHKTWGQLKRYTQLRPEDVVL